MRPQNRRRDRMQLADDGTHEEGPAPQRRKRARPGPGAKWGAIVFGEVRSSAWANDFTEEGDPIILDGGGRESEPWPVVCTQRGAWFESLTHKRFGCSRCLGISSGWGSWGRSGVWAPLPTERHWIRSDAVVGRALALDDDAA